jgi:hypothetical protein
VGAALGWYHRVDFVDDDRVGRDQPLAGVRGEQEKQRFRRRDENVGRLALKPRPLLRCRVAGPNRDGRHVDRSTRCVRHVGDADERRPEIPLDVHGECLQRRDVNHPAALFGRRQRLEHQPVEAPQKRRERLAAAGRCQDQRGFATCDRGPSQLLRARRRREGAREPLAHRGVEELQRARCWHPAILHDRRSRFQIPCSRFRKFRVRQFINPEQEHGTWNSGTRNLERGTGNVDNRKIWVTPEKDSSTRNPASPSAWKNVNRKSARPSRRQGADPERARQLESFRLARTEMQRQLELATHDARKEQLRQAIGELDRRITELS